MLEHDRRQRRQGDIDAVGPAMQFCLLGLDHAQVPMVAPALDRRPNSLSMSEASQSCSFDVPPATAGIAFRVLSLLQNPRRLYVNMGVSVLPWTRRSAGG